MVSLLEYHTMAPQKDTETFEWTYLIRPDKSPSPQLEQLCLGIANLISKLKTSNPSNGLTPEKLAAFYRTVGGNYDSLFLSTPNSSLSFIYQSLGCFHVLQPSSNPFEPPSTPALLPHGFIRWQTIQLLLCPGEHSSFLKEAVKYFDVVNPSTGATFPKDIPNHVFPSEPDAEMVKWHDTLSKRLELEYEASRVRKDPAAQHPRGTEKPPNPEPSRPPSSVNDSSKPQPQNENDYFSYATRATRPGVFLRMQSHEAYSPFTRPVPRGEPLDDHDTPELDADTARTFRHVGPDRDPPRTSTSSRQSRTRERSRTPSRHRHSSRRRGHRSRNRNRVESSDSSVSSGDDDDEDEDEVEDERYTRSSRRRQRPISTSRRSNNPNPISRSADGRRLRGLHSRLLSSERSEGRRRHSHDAPLSRSHRGGTTSRTCSGSGSPYRRAPPPPPHPLSNLHQTIQVEIVPSDTELDTATDTDLDRGHGHGYDGTEDELEYEHGHGRERERELDGDDDDDDDSPSEHHYTPETKRARDFYYTGVHHIPKSKSKTKPSRRRPEYIVLPASSSSSSNNNSSNNNSSNNTSPSTITSPSTSTSASASTAAATAGTSPIRATTTATRTTTPSKPIKYKEYILIEPDSPVSAPPPTFTAPTYATHTHARMMPSSHSRYASASASAGGGAMHTPIPITTQAPSLSRKSSRSGGRWASHDPSRSGSGGGLHPRGTRYG